MTQTSNDRSPVLRGDFLGGITTFLTVSYIVVVNPSILSTPGTGIPFSGALTATVALCFLMTLLMGVYAKIPFAVAPGMGINAFFAYTVILENKVPWPQALGIVFWAGIIFLLCSLTPIRVHLARAIPGHLRIASAVGIGIFLTFIGLQKAGIVETHPVTLVTSGQLDLKTLLAVFGLFLITWLMHRKNPAAFLIGIFSVTAIGAAFGLTRIPDSLFSRPDFQSVFFKLDVLGALKLAFVPAILGIFFTDLFDSISTFMGVSKATGLVDRDGEPRRLREGLIVDAWATLGAGLVGTSSGTAYIESAAGIEAGAKTGRASVVTAICFLPCLFIGPLVSMIPAFATAPVLILVGALMFRTVTDLNTKKLEEVIPAFLAIVLIPLTFSITQGLLWGFVAHCLLYSLVGRKKEISRWMWLIGVISLLMLWLEGH